jgi:hypothetical protein
MASPPLSQDNSTMLKKIDGLSGMFLLALALPSFALLNGFAVTTIRNYCHNDFTLYYSRTFGNIVKFTIAEGKVTRCDTIYKKTLADFPTINLSGTKVAFVHKDSAGAWNNGRTKKYLSVMDADGGNVRDLDTIPGYYGEGGEAKILLEWPAGDWIYYCRGGNVGGPDPVWKINSTDPSKRQQIFTYKCMYSFSLSLDATKSSITSTICSDAQAWYCNALYTFPPAADPRGDWPTAVSYGCGSYISPSGNYHVHFQDQGHTILGVNTLNWSSHTASATLDIRQNPSFAQWSGLPQDSVGADKMWYSRWAVNSDKWICALTQNANLLNMQLLVNWVDHQAIAMPHGPSNVSPSACSQTDVSERSAEAGDLWVAGGPCGSYEDINGNWVSAGICTEAAPRSIRTGFDGISKSHKVNIYTAQGKLLGAWDRGTISATLPAGIYFAACGSGGISGTAQIRVIGSGVRR